MKHIIFITLLFTRFSGSVIYRLNDTDFLRMPPVYHLDDYDSCVGQTNGTYCYVEMELVSDTPSALLQMIVEYSEKTSSHFNHTRLHHGICLTKTCINYFQQNKVADPIVVLERCLNDSLWRDYRLKTRISNMTSCKKLDEPRIINIGDIGAAIFFICLALLNIIGSLYDYLFTNGNKGNEILLSFSFKQNYKKLTAQGSKDPYRVRLKGVHGLRLLSIVLVILAHAPLPIILGTENPHGLEKTYYDIIYHIFYNGSLIVQTFFIMTGFLMAYNIRKYSEKNELSWILIPKGILMRWIRLTPAYVVVLIFTLTWMRFMGSGPLWEVAVGVEVADCHRFGWLNIIYLNNYNDNSQCMPHTWYLAADMQLYILGLFVFIMTNESKIRNYVLLALFTIGFLIPAIHTYVQDLDAIVIIGPETARTFFVNDATFNNSYKRGHTNIPSIVLGLALGNLIYEGLRDERRIKKYKFVLLVSTWVVTKTGLKINTDITRFTDYFLKYLKKLKILYYLTVPTGVALIAGGMLFYGDRPRPSIYLRTVLAALIRPFFAFLVTVFFIGMVFKFENLYRRIIEWRGWRVPARVSYSAYLIHITNIRIFAGMNRSLLHYGMAQCFKEAFGIILLTFVIAYPFYLFVEAPLNQAIPVILRLSQGDKKDNEDQTMYNIENQNDYVPTTGPNVNGN